MALSTINQSFNTRIYTRSFIAYSIYVYIKNKYISFCQNKIEKVYNLRKNFFVKKDITRAPEIYNKLGFNILLFRKTQMLNGNFQEVFYTWIILGKE